MRWLLPSLRNQLTASASSSRPWEKNQTPAQVFLSPNRLGAMARLCWPPVPNLLVESSAGFRESPLQGLAAVPEHDINISFTECDALPAGALSRVVLNWAFVVERAVTPHARSWSRSPRCTLVVKSWSSFLGGWKMLREAFAFGGRSAT